LQLLRTAALRGGPASEVERAQILGIYRTMRPDSDTIQKLAHIAQDVVYDAFNAQPGKMAQIARDWPSMNTGQRESVLSDFTALMNQHLGMDVEINFFNLPADANGRVRHGYYSPGTDTIHLNINNASTENLAKGLKTVFHEMIHAKFFNMTKHLTANQVVEKAISGEITYTDALAYFNLREGLYFAASDVGQRTYEMNPHEQLAFIGQFFWERESKARGLPDPHTTFSADHPLATHLQGLDYRFA
jgi:hypothetical protein